MTATWNVRDETGALVDSLDGLAAVLRTSTERAAKSLLDDPDLAAAAPAALVDEAKAAKKPGGGTPPPISNGSFVAWDGGEGRVDLVVTNGKVPGVSEDVEGTAKSPAARVVVYEDGKATGKKIGASTHTLRRIAPPAAAQKKSAHPGRLVSLLSEHETKCTEMDLPSHSHVTGFALKAVYDRGLQAWPGERATTLTRQEWAIGRVEHFVKVAAGDVAPRAAGHDTDLLAPEHPLHTPTSTKAAAAPATDPAAEPEVPDGAVVLDVAEVESQVKALMEGIG